MERVVFVLLWVVAAQNARAAMITEDFEANDNSGAGGFDQAFNHQIGPDEFRAGYSPHSRFDSGRFTSPGHSLFIGSGTDYVTFNLDPGQYVSYAEVWTTSYQNNPPAYFHVIGTQGELLRQIPGGFTSPFVPFDTSSVNLGAITEIRLTGPEAYFDDLKINVVPEPATAALLATGGLLLRNRRKGRRIFVRLTPLFVAFATYSFAGPIYQAGESPRVRSLQSLSGAQHNSTALSPPGGETFDIVFVLDGSGSVTDPSWGLQKWGVANCFDPASQNRFIPSNGTVAISVVRFEAAYEGSAGV